MSLKDFKPERNSLQCPIKDLQGVLVRLGQLQGALLLATDILRSTETFSLELAALVRELLSKERLK